ncbi:hypothetical protein WJX82_009735 [Trebouxia sp. C0006]
MVPEHRCTALNDFIDRKLQASPIKRLIVYPEGHRSTKQQSLPMQRGMLHFAYDRKYPVQHCSKTSRMHLCLHCVCNFGSIDEWLIVNCIWRIYVRQEFAVLKMDISHRFAEVIEANLYDRNAEPAEQARLCSALFADPDIVAAAKTLSKDIHS